MIERKLSKSAGVSDVRASERRGEVVLISNARLKAPSLADLQDALAGTPYILARQGDAASVTHASNDAPRWYEAGGMLILLIATYLLFKRFDVISLSDTTENVASLGAVFAVGLVAAASTCLAVVGGLLLGVSAKWSETRQSATPWQKFQPLALFNIGRLGGYFVLGGMVGVLGNALTISTRATGVLTILIALVMIILGLTILRIVPKRYCTLPLPRSLARRITELTQSDNPLAPLLLGALTFFLPCGFTQSMQLLALGTGSFVAGGIIMFTFAFGTLPALLGLSVVSSIARGRGARLFYTFSGTAVLLLGLLNIQSGFLLTGVDAVSAMRSILPTAAEPAIAGNDPYVTMNAEGQQIITMYVTDYGYQPESFTIQAGIPTWIYAIAQNRVSGCASMLTSPTHNLSTPIRQGDNWLGPIQSPQKDFVVTCSMGMMRANVRVHSS